MKSNCMDNKVNPFRCTSTLICIICLTALTGINLMAVKTGFFDEAFALVSVYLIKDILVAVFGHQSKSDAAKAQADVDLSKETISISTQTPPPVPKP